MMAAFAPVDEIVSNERPWKCSFSLERDSPRFVVSLRAENAKATL
jgi:hypothetical protein